MKASVRARAARGRGPGGRPEEDAHAGRCRPADQDGRRCSGDRARSRRTSRRRNARCPGRADRRDVRRGHGRDRRWTTPTIRRLIRDRLRVARGRARPRRHRRVGLPRRSRATFSGTTARPPIARSARSRGDVPGATAPGTTAPARTAVPRPRSGRTPPRRHPSGTARSSTSTVPRPRRTSTRTCSAVAPPWLVDGEHVAVRFAVRTQRGVQVGRAAVVARGLR